MKRFMMVVLVACAFVAVGCEEKKPADAPNATATGSAKAAPAPAKSGGGGW